MTGVQLELPDEIISQINVSGDSFRDVAGLAIAIDSLDVAASVITVVSLRQQLPDLARAIRSWVMGRPRDAEPARLLVKNADFEMKIDLPPNVQTAQIVDAISGLLASLPGEKLDSAE
jgi:hypothetical protein